MNKKIRTFNSMYSAYKKREEKIQKLKNENHKLMKKIENYFIDNNLFRFNKGEKVKYVGKCKKLNKYVFIIKRDFIFYENTVYYLVANNKVSFGKLYVNKKDIQKIDNTIKKVKE